MKKNKAIDKLSGKKNEKLKAVQRWSAPAVQLKGFPRSGGWAFMTCET